MDMAIFLPILIIGMIAMMWWSSRQNKKKQKEAQEFRESIKKGQTIMTNSGMIGKVVSVNKDKKTVIIDSQGTESEWVEQAISQNNPVVEEASKQQVEQEKEYEVEYEDVPAKKVVSKKTPSKKSPVKKVSKKKRASNKK